MTKPPPPAHEGASHGAHLVAHDIQLRRGDPERGEPRVVASIHCARKNCTMLVEKCGPCPHFVRIETHEAGYIMLCHDQPSDERGEAELSPPSDPDAGHER